MPQLFRLLINKSSLDRRLAENREVQFNFYFEGELDKWSGIFLARNSLLSFSASATSYKWVDLFRTVKSTLTGKMNFDQVERLSKRVLEQGKEVLFSQLCITFLFLFSLSQNSSYHYSNLRSRTNTKIRSYIDKNMFQVDEELKGRLAAVTRGFEVHPYLVCNPTWLSVLFIFFLCVDYLYFSIQATEKYSADMHWPILDFISVFDMICISGICVFFVFVLSTYLYILYNLHIW